MKPSEKFASLKQAAESLDDCQDKKDLLGLFRLADKLHLQVSEFGRVVSAMKRTTQEQWRILRKERAQVKILLGAFELERKQKVVSIKSKKRENMANGQT